MELSVVIPVYNGEQTLSATLDSLFAQAPLPFEWEAVAVDDGSLDTSLSILHQYEKKAKEKGIVFRVFSYENSGVGTCRNRCLYHASGTFILFLDADDRLEKGALLYAMEKRKELDADLFLFDSQFLFEDGSVSPFPMADHPGGKMSIEDYMLSHPCPWNKIIKKELFQKQNLSFEEGILYEDLALIPALGKGAEGKIHYAKKILHSYYQSSSSIMRSPFTQKRMDILPALRALRRNVDGYDDLVEYLFWLHLYRNFCWLCVAEGRFDAIRSANALMKETFPLWQKNPIIRKRASKKERLTSLLFYREHFLLLRLWKGGKK